MSAFLSPVFGAGSQFFNNAGQVLSGGKLYTYQAGSTAQQSTWTASTQLVQNANPIVLDSYGRVPQEIWLQGGSTYKFVLTDSNGNTLGTWDNIAGVNDANYNPFSEWVPYGVAPSYVSATSFTVPGNQTSIFQVGRRIQASVAGGPVYGNIATSTFGSGVTTVTLTMDSTNLDNTLSSVAYGFMSAINSSLPVTVYAPIASPVFTGTPQAPTAAPGTNTNQIATMAALIAQAFATALPNQAGNAGKFVTTNGTTASWAYANIATINATVTSSTTISGTSVYVPVLMASLGQSVTLPNATTLTPGGPQYIIDNTKGTYPAGIRDNTGTLIMAVAAGGEAFVSLKDNSTAAGIWSVTGTNLEPGLITIDNTFSSTYSSAVLAPFVALDNNTSIHFAALASGFAAFVVDNTGRVLTTPVTVDSTASSTPKTVFKIDATHAIVFYGSSTTTNSCVVLTLSGSSPSYSLAVGTPQTYATALGSNWDGENFTGAPKIAQLSSSLYVASNVNGTNTSVIAISVSGAAITIGSAANIITASSVAGSTTTYALTSTTALVIYLSGAGPYQCAAVVISVSGTTCTVGTPSANTNGASSVASTPCSVLLSSTKCIIVTDANATLCTAQVVTISGTTATLGTYLSVESTASLALQYTSSSATRYNPHLWAIGSNTAGLWYLDSSGVSRAVVLTESAGTITAGTISYKNVSNAASDAAGFGQMLPQGASEFCALAQQVVNTAGYSLALLPSKISGTSITPGAGRAVRNTMQTNPLYHSATRLSGGDYVLGPDSNNGKTSSLVMPVFRSNGDAINYRGEISCPPMYMGSATALSGSYNNAVSSNRLVILGATAVQNGGTAALLRLINVEIAQ